MLYSDYESSRRVQHLSVLQNIVLHNTRVKYGAQKGISKFYILPTVLYILAEPAAHPASCTIGTGSFPGVKSVRGVTLTLTPFECRGQEKVELYPNPQFGSFGLYRVSVPVQGCILPFYTFYFNKVNVVWKE